MVDLNKLIATTLGEDKLAADMPFGLASYGNQV